MQKKTISARGFSLLEVLIAIVIFSIGLLGLISMQARAIKQAGDAKLRAEASYLANQIIGQIWADRSNILDYIHNPTTTAACTFSGAVATSSNVTNWLGATDKKGTVLGTLPNAAAQIKIETGTNVVTVTLCWRAPQETETHQFTSSGLISG